MRTMPEAISRSTAHVSFSGHETFVCRYGWLKKAVDAVSRTPQAFVADDAMVELGVGKNMVRSIRHWALAMNVVEEIPGTRGADLRLSALGMLLLPDGGADPYLEDPNSLWLLHWQLVTNERRATTWTWAFNLLRTHEFTRDALVGMVQAELRRRNLTLPSEHSLRRDVDCFVRTYVRTRQSAVVEDSLECPLTELGLLDEEVESGVLQFNAAFHRTLGMPVFVFALLEFWRSAATGRETLPFSDIAYGFGSPGLSFKLDENSLTERLERLERATDGRLVYMDTAGIRQVYLRGGPMQSMDVLSGYYDHADGAILVEG
jgi:hypothetical protein